MSDQLKGEAITTWKRLHPAADTSDVNACVRRSSDQARLALALNDLEIAREIDMAGQRAFCTSNIHRNRGDRTAVLLQIELARQIPYQLLREQTLAGLVGGMADPTDLSFVRRDALRATDDGLRDTMLKRMAVCLREPDLIGEISGYRARLEAQVQCALTGAGAELAREALEAALDEGDLNGMIRALHAIGLIDDGPLKKRATRIAAKLTDPGERIMALDSLGKCGLNNTYARSALKMLSELPEFKPEDWDDVNIEGTRDFPLSYLARRHFNPVLASRIRAPILRSAVMSEVAVQRRDLDLTHEIEGVRDRLGARIRIGRETSDLDLVRQSAAVCRRQRFDELLFESQLAEIELLAY